jgi:phage gp36-like protein
MAYITQDELEELALPAGAQGGLSDAIVLKQITRASEEADVYLASRYKLPLLAWGNDLKGWVADIAAFFCLKRIGFNPEAADHKVYKDAHDEALAKLLLVSKRLLHPNITDSAKLTRAPRMESQKLRGW